MTVVKMPTDNWRKGLILTEKKQPKKSLANTMHVLATHPKWRGVLVFDEFAQSVVTTKAPPMRPQDAPVSYTPGDWSDDDTARTVAWFAAEDGIRFEPATNHVDQAVAAVARKRCVHPVRDWLQGLQWDQQQRLDLLFVRYFGSADSKYSRAIAARFAIGAVARIMRPGCKVDTAIVFEGPQGAFKSTGCRTLAGDDWFADTGITIGDKDSYQALRRKWIFELAELSALKGREIERIKNFLSSPVDTYRPPYGRRTRDFPRQTIFIGTTNEHHYLIDPTGNRRFWPVKCGTIDIEALKADRDQIWAEARCRFEAGERWYLDTPELVALAVEEQGKREQQDDWIGLIERWLVAPSVPVAGSTRERDSLDVTSGITTADVLRGALDFTPDKINQAATIRVGHALRKLEFEPKQERASSNYKARERRYYRSQIADARDNPRDTGGAENVPESHVTVVTDTCMYEKRENSAARFTEVWRTPTATTVTCDVDPVELEERRAIEEPEGGGE